MVNIFVGPKRKRYHVHKDLLCNRSEYFRAMFQGGYQETQTKEVFLVDEDASAIALFITWIYGTTLRGPADVNESSAYLGLLALSEKFLIEQLHNECIDLIRAYFRDGFKPVLAKDVKYVYDNLNDQKLCHLLIRLVAKKALRLGLLGIMTPSALPQEFQILARAGGDCAMDLANFLALGLEYLNTFEDSRNYNCAYHRHSGTAKCHGPEVEYDAFRGPRIVQLPMSRHGENKVQRDHQGTGELTYLP